MATTVERPLFNATRRPAPVAVAEAPKPTIQRGQFTLTGTMITDKSAVAFLKEAAGAGKARSVRKGDSINGMNVAEIAPDRVRLTLGDESEDVELKVAKGPKTTVQPAGDAPAPQQVAGQQPQPGQSGRGRAAPARAARAGSRAQGGLAGQGDATENVRANRRAARAAEASGGAQGDQTQQTQTSVRAATPPTVTGFQEATMTRRPLRPETMHRGAAPCARAALLVALAGALALAGCATPPETKEAPPPRRSARRCSRRA